MNQTEIITATTASRSFSDLLNRVCYNGESFTIKKGNRLMARITPVAQDAENTAETYVPQQASYPGLPQEELPENVTEEEAEYFKTVLAQLREGQKEPA